ncbi:MAG: malto-oligosyltrehalose trehalohydrolase [Burkholderiaceae bacterium]
MPFGAALQRDGSTVFRLWAPSQTEVAVELEQHGQTRQHRLLRQADGWHTATIGGAGAGTRYKFVLADGLGVPDPASRFNPDGVHASSEVIDPLRYRWRDAAWRGRPWHEAVVYELHIGTFTSQGTFAAALERLADLAELGITAIELMPVEATPGQRNWGYDGVLQFAPQPNYGTPDELKALVDGAHALGLMVLLDVVCNHFGPDGNYLHVYCPEFFNPEHQTPWGSAINFDGHANAEVRRFFRHNALYWIEEFHFDGLRLDAIHQIRDNSAVDIVREIAAALQAGPGRERAVHLVLENDNNDASLLQQAEHPPGAGVAQWNDDWHHCAHVLLTGETDGYYRDYAEHPVQVMARALAEGFVFQGQMSVHHQGPRGESSLALAPTAFIPFLQNHDQTGNRAFGERVDALATSQERLAVLLACLLLSPQIPMLFMGEEFAASSPFLYFCDFEGDLARAVTEGRRREFAHFAAFVDPASREGIPDPNAVETFERSKLRWEERAEGEHASRLALIRTLLQLRHTHLVPVLAGCAGAGTYESDGDLLRVQWQLGDKVRWQFIAKLGDAPVASTDMPMGATVYADGEQRVHGDVLELKGAAVRVVKTMVLW